LQLTPEVTNKEVRAIQDFLGAKVDGKIGPETTGLIKKYQESIPELSSSDNPATGQLDQATRESLARDIYDHKSSGPRDTSGGDNNEPGTEASQNSTASPLSGGCGLGSGCLGKGATKTVMIDGKERTIKIPAGSDDGVRIRFNEFDIRLQVSAHPTFKRDGDDIYVDVAVPFWQAILGGEIVAPTIDGDVRVKIRPGTQPATMIRLRDQGVQRLQGRGRGDEYLRLVVTIPEKVSREQREALGAFEK
jgi:hypothetical protein